MLIKYLAYAPSIIGILLVFTFIALNNIKSKLNRLFMVLMAITILWLSCLFIADTSGNVPAALWAVRFGVLFSTLLGPAFVLFSKNFPREHRTSKTELFAILLPAIIVGLTALTPYMIKGVTLGPNGATLTSTTLFYTLDTVLILIYFAYGTWILVRSRRSSGIIEKSQINLVLAAILTVFIINFITGYLLAVLGFDGSANLLGAFSMVIFSVIVAYAMVKHQLFDIRSLVARSFAYLFSLLVLGGLFIAVASAIVGLIFSSEELGDTTVRWIYTVLAIVVALLYPPLKKYFDKITNRIFYRDAYDSQEFLESFNKVLITHYDLNPLLRKASMVIQDTLKVSYCAFGLKETENSPQRIVGTAGRPNFSMKDAAFVRSLTPHMRRKIINTDTLESKYVDLQRVLQANNISIIARLASSINEEGMGYLILGPKKSGNLYSSQDLKMIEIVSNELIIAIQNALRTEEIENFNITLQEKVNEATRKIRRTNEKLKQMDETKDDFISMASHQLRTPLTSVKGYISMVLEEDAGKITPMQREMLGQAFFSSQRMVYLIADLLNVSRLKTGKFIIDRAPIKLDQIVEQELRQLKETAASRSLTLDFETPKDFPTLMLDETKTRQIIMNFVDNAIYYTPAGGHVKVKLVNNPSSVELRVEDDGIGVPKAEQAHLFTKFYRAGNARQARPDGTGLGLFMAKKVIVAQGGALLFDSEENKGSTFGFIFSKSAATGIQVPVPHLQDVEVVPEPEPALKR